MNITCIRKTYHTSDEQERARLKSNLYRIRQTHPDVAATISTQIESASWIDGSVLSIYKISKGIQPAINDFQSNQIQKVTLASSRYVYIPDAHGFFKLPHTAQPDSILYALIDKYLYERQRHLRTSDACTYLFAALVKYNSQIAKMSDNKLKSMLAQYETTTKTYYGDDLSDDSDSDDDNEFSNKPSKEKKFSAHL